MRSSPCCQRRFKSAPPGRLKRDPPKGLAGWTVWSLHTAQARSSLRWLLRGDCLLSCARSDDAGLAFVFEAITLALDLDDLAVMQEAVEHGGG